MYRNYEKSILKDNMVMDGFSQLNNRTRDEIIEEFIKPIFEEIIGAKKAYRGVYIDPKISLDQFIETLQEGTPIGKSWTYDKDIAVWFANGDRSYAD